MHPLTLLALISLFCGMIVKLGMMARASALISLRSLGIAAVCVGGAAMVLAVAFIGPKAERFHEQTKSMTRIECKVLAAEHRPDGDGGSDLYVRVSWRFTDETYTAHKLIPWALDWRGDDLTKPAVGAVVPCDLDGTSNRIYPPSDLNYVSVMRWAKLIVMGAAAVFLLLGGWLIWGSWRKPDEEATGSDLKPTEFILLLAWAFLWKACDEAVEPALTGTLGTIALVTVVVLVWRRSG